MNRLVVVVVVVIPVVVVVVVSASLNDATKNHGGVRTLPD